MSDYSHFLHGTELREDRLNGNNLMRIINISTYRNLLDGGIKVNILDEQLVLLEAIRVFEAYLECN